MQPIPKPRYAKVVCPMSNITSTKDSDGIVTLTWDMPGRSMNVISQASDSEFKAACLAAIADPLSKAWSSRPASLPSSLALICR